MRVCRGLGKSSAFLQASFFMPFLANDYLQNEAGSLTHMMDILMIGLMVMMTLGLSGLLQWASVAIGERRNER